MQNDKEKVIIRESQEKMTISEINDYIDLYKNSEELRKLNMYDEYYEGKNYSIEQRFKDRHRRGIMPNNIVPTAYYSTVVDTMAGYMFSDVNYITTSETFKNVMVQNDSSVKDMVTGIKAIAYNKAIELVYTRENKQGEIEIRYTFIDPREIILIYTADIEKEIFAAIRVYNKNDENNSYNVDVIYSDEIQFYLRTADKLTVRDNPKPLFFSECPIIRYRTEIMTNNSPFNVILAYIDALDFLVTGNYNDLEGLMDALLVISNDLPEDKRKHLNELRALILQEKDDRAEFLVKDMNPAFREYVSKLLIQEIHKHSHVIDWYSPDTGLSGAVSAKALRTRLFDMDMYSYRLEKIYRSGMQKRIRLISELIKLIYKEEIDYVEVVFNRTIPDDFEDKAPVLNQLTFLSDQTKLERLGIDPEVELSRLEEQKTANMERFSLPMPNNEEDEEE
jgi:SPP1 family phage portal protein